MTDRKSVLCVIPARGGSTGVPRKNLRRLSGMPLLAHTLEHARAAKCIQRIVVSTDDGEIADLARARDAGVVIRPPELSTDTASSETAIAHALDSLKRAQGYAPDVVVFLQCTCPFREADDIDRAADVVLRGDADSVLSVVPFHGFLWTRGDDAIGMPLNYDPGCRPRRQDMPPTFRENGSIYVFTTELFQRTGVRVGGRIAMHVMDEMAALDIDSELDFQLAEALAPAQPSRGRDR